MPELTFMVPETQLKVILCNEVVSKFESCIIRNIENETGGQLFATFPSSEELRIVYASGPHEKTTRRLFSVRFDLRTDQKEIERLFKQKKLHYVGDWHSHPQEIPVPSWIDKRTMRSRFIKSKHELNLMIMIIVGQAELPAGLWIGSQDASQLQELAITF